MYGTGQYDYQILQQLISSNSNLESVITRLNSLIDVGFILCGLVFMTFAVYVLLKWVKNK